MSLDYRDERLGDIYRPIMSSHDVIESWRQGLQAQTSSKHGNE